MDWMDGPSAGISAVLFDSFNINKDIAYVITGSPWHFIQTVVDTRLQNSAIENPFRKKVLMRNFMPYISGPNGIWVRRGKKKSFTRRTLSFQLHEEFSQVCKREKVMQWYITMKRGSLCWLCWERIYHWWSSAGLLDSYIWVHLERRLKALLFRRR